jgi:hypothetical protein
MLPSVEFSDLVSDQLVKSITPDFIITDVCDLDDLVALNLTKRQIEGPATPVEDQNPAAIEFRESATIIRL